MVLYCLHSAQIDVSLPVRNHLSQKKKKKKKKKKKVTYRSLLRRKLYFFLTPPLSQLLSIQSYILTFTKYTHKCNMNIKTVTS